MRMYPTLSLTLALCLPLCGCGSHRPAMHVYIGLDASLSARTSLGSYALLTKSLAEQLTPGHDRFTLYRVDHDTQEFCDGLYDGDVEATLKTTVAEIQTPSQQRGTLPAKFWQTVAARAASERAPSVVFLMTDGDNDDRRPESWQSLTEAGRRLSACPTVRSVVVCGARRENWEHLKQALAPLGNRLYLLTPTQLQAEKVLPHLDQAQW